MNTPGKKSLPVIPCGVAIIRQERSFLIAQRNPEDTLGSYWEFPGGKKERRESFEDCVVREVEEEIGIRIRVERPFMVIRKKFNEKIIWLNYYLCAYLSGEPRPIDCQNVLWTDVMELGRYKFPPANRRVIDQLVREFASSDAVRRGGIRHGNPSL